MADVIYLLVVVAFFGLMVLLVRFCDHIIGPDDGLNDASERVDDAERADAEVGS